VVVVKTYRFVGNHTDKDTLEELGFVDDNWGGSNPIELDTNNDFEAIRVKRNGKIAVTVDTYDSIVSAYRYEGHPNRHVRVKDIDPSPYIKDLIELGLVKEIKEEE
jgi:hypothetical protein